LVSFERGQGEIEGGDQPAVAPGLGGQGLPVPSEGLDTVELRRGQHRPDGLQREFEFPMEEDLLQAQQLLAAVIAIAVLAHLGGLEQADLVVVMQGAHRDARDLRQLFDRIAAHRRSSSCLV
jgi:hypothetical protein